MEKRVRFAEPFHPPGGGNKFTDDYRDLRTSVRTVTARKTSVKRVGAVQVFCPKTSKLEDFSAYGYRLSRVFDDISLCRSPYSGQRSLRFQVATAYKTKAKKVRPVDPSGTDGSKPGGCLDWFEKSKASDVPSRLGRYSDWITPKFSDIQKGSRLTEERIKDLVVGDGLWPKERELFLEVLYNQEKALAFDFTDIGKVKPDVAPP